MFLAILTYLSSFSLSIALRLVILVAIFVSLSFVVASLSEEAAVLGFKVGLRVVVADRAALFEGGFERVVEDYWNNESLPGGELALSSLLII